LQSLLSTVATPLEALMAILQLDGALSARGLPQALANLVSDRSERFKAQAKFFAPG